MSQGRQDQDVMTDAAVKEVDALDEMYFHPRKSSPLGRLTFCAQYNGITDPVLGKKLEKDSTDVLSRPKPTFTR